MPHGSAAEARPSGRPWRIARSLELLAILTLVGQSGCTALLSTTALRDGITGAADAVGEATGDEPAAVAVDDAAEDAATDAEPLVLVKPKVSAEQTIDEAIDRLAAAGRLDQATQSALIAMLEESPQEDWPEIIDAFVESLEATHVAAKPVAHAAATPPVVAPPPAEPAAPAAAAVVAALDPAPAPAKAPAEPLLFPTIEPAAAIVPLVEPVRPSLRIANACFASRVRGWGQVDRFATSRFHQGQDVIVYFELEELESQATDAGHRTQVDTTLRLVADDGRALHDWSFEPVEETCPARRRDYFVRYVLRLPAGLAPGPCRLEVEATDAVGGRTATASLPLEIAAP